MYRQIKEVEINIKLNYEYDREYQELRELLKQIIDMTIVKELEVKTK